MIYEQIFRNAVASEYFTDSEYRALLDPEPSLLHEFLGYARRLRERAFGRRIGLCSIVSAKSGKCSEDCAFCAQSMFYKTGAPEHDVVEPGRVAEAARQAVADGSSRFGIVASGFAPGAGEFDALKAAVRAARGEGLTVDVSVGCLDAREIRALKEAGASGVHHNLETGPAFFPSVCTTHDYEDDVEAVRTAKQAGAYVCSGGVFGLGESWEDRLELALTLRALGVDSVPINFLMPVPGTPMENRPLLSQEEALRIVALFRFIIPQAHIRVAGGRHAIFPGHDRRRLYAAGASGVMVGDYLTRAGAPPAEDAEDLVRLGLEPERIAENVT
ncbi:biotin synthase BioB [Oceanidesulfovibrio indonesiensis]|uniref:biotin synthase BioB n=1 Tax=Oceanidesulfovibrio indonesiensis TaxID=54767 RepID=UPI001430E7E6|nr:biotin synthase BioB [Oceanidesulfovibrio indonesiensis]